MKKRWQGGLASLAMLPVAVSASVQLDDGTQGMTCYFYSAAARLAWERPGGDWLDAAGTAYGEQAFASAAVRRADGRQAVSIDVTSLAPAWLEQGVTEAAILLRDLGGDKGVVNFASRETADPEARPTLVIEWSDGSRSHVQARADTYFSCPNHRGYGGEPQFKVGGKHAAALAFPLERRGKAAIRSAWLELTSDKQYGNGVTVGVFQLSLPGAGSAVEQGIAQSFVRDKGIADHPDVLHAEGVEDGAASAWRGVDMKPGSAVVASDPANRFEPLQGSALSVTIEKGRNAGLNAHLRLAGYRGGEPDEAYFRYYLRLGDSWNPTIDGGKMPGFSGTYGRGGWGMRKSDGSNGWSARGAFFRQSRGTAADLRGIGSYVYHADMEGNSGDTWGWSLGPSGLLRKNQWYGVEQHVRLNTPGKADGVLRAWIDGRLVFERKDIRFRDSTDLKIESVWLNVYHGGIKPAPADMTLFIDNLVIARKYIGPMKMAR